LWIAVPALLFTLLILATSGSRKAEAAPAQTAGSLEILGKKGEVTGACPLKHTEVRGAISGFLARVTVTQVFENSASQKIEAVYVFPLPQDAAVDDMTIQVGDRTVRGVIKKREEARAIYEKAKQTGHVAALLDQERPNIFTQSVANIMPGEQVTVTISYVEALRYEEGAYEFVFPMVVGPRYTPGEATGKQAGGREPDTDQVPDASRITPQITPQGTRAGHDISLELAIDAGVPIQELRSSSHKIDVERTGASSAKVRLRNQATIPNKDFILKYAVAGERISDAVLTTAAPAGSKAAGGYFTLILQPPARVAESDITPKELVFVLDTSGSMSGFPVEKAKKLISRALDELYAGDTFNLVTFAGDSEILFPEPVYPTAENIRRAKAFLQSRSGGGGTEMMKAIRAALDPSDEQDHIRVVCFATDGYVGNDMEIIGEIQKHPNARVFSFGIGNGVNRFLLDGMARAGRGAVEYVTLADKADEAAKRLYERLRAPLLTDVSVDWGGLPVTDVYPRRISDLFSGQPVVVTGRYTSAAHGTIRLRGTRAGEPFSREIPVELSLDASAHRVLAGFWARRKIDDLMSQDWTGMQSGSVKPAVEKEITQLGLDYRLMTQFTSFVAVEERVVTKDGKPVRVEVPVEMPEGVRYEGIFGDEKNAVLYASSPGLTMYEQMGMASRTMQVQAGAQHDRLGQSTKLQQRPSHPPPPPPRSQITEAERSDKAGDLKTTPSPERTLLESKLHRELLAALDCRKKSGTDCQLPQPGKVNVQIFLAEASTTVVDQIKALGFEVTQTRPKTLIGHLPVEKLEALAKIAQVRFVAPARR
jgi:Ca-activated chloride channel family protein